jgi:hypothetical protein
MTEQERTAYVLQYSQIKAFKLYSKLPQQVKSAVEVEDLQQNLCLHYFEQRHSYDESKDFKPWVHTVMNSRGIDEVTRIWDDFVKCRDSHDYTVPVSKEYGEEGSYELVLLDINSPEMLCISYYEELLMGQKIEIFTTEVRSLCKRFEIEYNPANYVESFVQVLDYTLNQMSDAEFKVLPFSLQKKLAGYGEEMNRNNLQITKNGKFRNLGIVDSIRTCIQGGIYEFKDIKKELKKKNLEYTDSSIRTIIWNEKKRAGVEIKRKQAGILRFVQQKFDYGKGVVTVAEMLQELRAADMPHSPVTVRTYVQKLRAGHGLTKTR